MVRYDKTTQHNTTQDKKHTRRGEQQATQPSTVQPSSSAREKQNTHLFSHTQFHLDSFFSSLLFLSSFLPFFLSALIPSPTTEALAAADATRFNHLSVEHSSTVAQ
jgi:hypothetical protein